MAAGLAIPVEYGSVTKSLLPDADHPHHGRRCIRRFAGRVDAIGFQEIAHRLGRHQHGLGRGRRRGACDHGRLQQSEAGKLAAVVARGRAGKADCRRRRKGEIAAARDRRNRRLDGGCGATAALILRVRDAGYLDVGLVGRIGGKAERLQSTRAVETQQRQIMILVLGDTIGIAERRNRNGDAAVGDLAVGHDRAILAHHDAGAVVDGLARRWCRCRRETD